jgi:hypothetical protein
MTSPSRLSITAAIASAASVAILVCAGPASAANRTVYVPLAEAIAAATASGKLDGSVKFYLAGTGPSGTVIEADVVTNKRGNASGKSDHDACVWTAQSALITLQDAAKKAGANAVTNLVSYYRKVDYRNPTNVECHAGAFISGVALKGDLSKAAR